MPTMVDIARVLPSAAACIRIYKNEIIISAPAAKLLGIPDNPGCRILVRQDADEAQRGRDRVYIARSDTMAGYPISKKDCRYRLISATLIRRLITHLEGYGTYRIDDEVPVVIGGITYYEIFFKKYE